MRKLFYLNVCTWSDEIDCFRILFNDENIPLIPGKDAEIAELGEPETEEPRQEESDAKTEEQPDEQGTEEKAMGSKDDAGEPAAQPAPKEAKGGSLDDVAQHDENDDRAEQEVSFEKRTVTPWHRCIYIAM